jgi:hypothetical protein
MCGRARLPEDYSEIKIKLKLDDLAPPPNWRGSWNLAPTQDAKSRPTTTPPETAVKLLERY